MSSNWQTFCDALIDDLTIKVPALQDVLVHRYAPWDPAELLTEVGERHLAVYPDADAVLGDPMTMASNELTEVYRIRYWEDAGDESTRGVTDQDGAVGMFDIAQAVQDRLHTTAIWTIGGAFHVRYIGTQFPERSGHTRSFMTTLQARRAKDITEG